MDKEFYKDNIAGIAKNIDDWVDEGFNLIVSLVIENGGFLKTPQCEEKPYLYAFYEDFDGLTYKVAIQGFHYDEELGLCICTDDTLNNYQYDTGWEFEYYWNFEGDDLDELNKALALPEYYVEFDRYNLVKTDTVINLLRGLPAYL